MIARIKTALAICGTEQPPCVLKIEHRRQVRPRKLLLPRKRYVNEPFACQVLPIHQEDHRLEWFNLPAELEESEHYRTFEEMATFLCEWEWGSVSHNYPRRCNEIEYLTCVQWNHRVIALVAIGPPENIGQQSERSVFDEYRLAFATHWNGRASCELLHARWGRGFINGIQKDAERSLERCLNRRKP